MNFLGKLSTNNPSATNSVNSPPAATDSPTNNALLPSVVMDHVPITAAINTLARAAGMNYIVIANLFTVTDSNSNVIEEEPVVTFRLKDVNPGEVLEQILNLHKLVLIKDPVTTVARIARTDQKINFVDASLIGLDTNKPAALTNGVIPSISFDEMPIDSALKSLIQHCTSKIELSERITGPQFPGHVVEGNGVIVGSGNITNKDVFPNSRFVPMPVISADWKNITAEQALVALCQICDLDIVKDATTGVIQIIPKP